MEIKTKYNLGDTVWSVTRNCETTTGTVYKIAIDKTADGHEIAYWCNGMDLVVYSEEQLCASYEELLKRISNSKRHEQEE